MRGLIRSMFVLVFAGWMGYTHAASITDTVFVDGNEWAQADLFLDLSWDDINAVCPGGVCGNGTLNGFDMAGWTWAASDDLNQLFNHYIGFAALGPGPDYWSNPLPGGYPVSNAFFADGWRPTFDYFGEVFWLTEGRVRDDSSVTALITRGLTFSYEQVEVARTDYPNNPDDDFIVPGAWFIRSNAEVPIPATLPLIAVAIVALGMSRRHGMSPS